MVHKCWWFVSLIEKKTFYFSVFFSFICKLEHYFSIFNGPQICIDIFCCLQILNNNLGTLIWTLPLTQYLTLTFLAFSKHFFGFLEPRGLMLQTQQSFTPIPSKIVFVFILKRLKNKYLDYKKITSKLVKINQLIKEVQGLLNLESWSRSRQNQDSLHFENV